jgi:molecular chaperone IbpA|tara:strand:- start:96 stop:515 length:420 start_codon:yes stop_codon:yes gene_type:complete
MELNMNTMIKVPNLLVDPAIWQGMITNLTTTKFPFMDLLRVADNEYTLILSVAGYTKDNLTVTMNGYILSVEGVWNSIDEKNVKYLVEGIAKRDFKREIPLAEHIQVGDVDLIDGMLYIQLQRDIPEELKPKSFAIRGA